jgi:hypothetical protein
MAPVYALDSRNSPGSGVDRGAKSRPLLASHWPSVMFLSLLWLLFFLGVKDWTQALARFRQALYHWTTSPALLHFFFCYVFIVHIVRISHTANTTKCGLNLFFHPKNHLFIHGLREILVPQNLGPFHFQMVTYPFSWELYLVLFPSIVLSHSSYLTLVVFPNILPKQKIFKMLT